MNMKIKRIIIGIFGISLVIVIHEFGHFLACKIFGVATPIFSIGFGPQLLAYRIGDTLFQIALLPLGGYVEIAPHDFALQPYGIKVIILLAGIIFNLVFAFGIFIILPLLPRRTIIPIIDHVIPNSPAAHALLQSGDEVTMIDGTAVTENITITQAILQSPGKTIQLTIKRNDHLLEIPVTLADTSPFFGANVGWLGVEWVTAPVKRPSWKERFKERKNTQNETAHIIRTFMANVFKKGQNTTLVGPVGIITITGASMALGYTFFLFILAILSLNIALFNVLPIPFFDGGKLVQYTIQAWYGPLPDQALNIVNFIVLGLLILFIIMLTFKDIRRLKK